MIAAAAALAAAISAAGLLQAAAGAVLTGRFAARPLVPPPARPPVTVLKPLYGAEALLEEGLATVCAQDYPDYQVVFGVGSAADPAIGVVHRLQARFPGCDIALVIDPTLHGENRKVGNLINMLPAAKHDVLVIADSDLHVQPDYLDRLVAALAQPGIGLVTTLYAGLPAQHRLAARFGATQITHTFLPGALLARAFGRQDCLGATMCLRRETLTRIGGLRALVDHLADDNLLGGLVQDLGQRVALADTVVLTTVPEATLRALFRHELRWARTIRALVPGAFAASALQYPLAWAALAMLLSGGAAWSFGWFALAWLWRAVAALAVDRALLPRLSAPATAQHQAGLPSAYADSRRLPSPQPAPATLPPGTNAPIGLLPLRDALSILVMLASYAGKRVDWRGHSLQAAPLPPPEAQKMPFRLDEGLNTQ